MKDIDGIISEIIKFRDERDWEQFHNGKDLALALSIEAAELNQLFLWKEAKDADIEKIKEELADVFNYAFLLANKYELDVREIVMSKIGNNFIKYGGLHRKYQKTFNDSVFHSVVILLL